MSLNRRRTHDEALGDLGVGETAGYEPQNLDFATRERCEVGRTGPGGLGASGGPDRAGIRSDPR